MENMNQINDRRSHDENSQSSVSDDSNLSTNSEINSSGKYFIIYYVI